MRKFAALYIVLFSIVYPNRLAYGKESVKATIVPAGNTDIQAFLSAILIVLILTVAAILIFRKGSRRNVTDIDK